MIFYKWSRNGCDDHSSNFILNLRIGMLQRTYKTQMTFHIWVQFAEFMKNTIEEA
jgi:hypothetical protein